MILAALAGILIGIEMRFKPRVASLSQAPAESPNRADPSRLAQLAIVAALFDKPASFWTLFELSAANLIATLRRRTLQESITAVRQSWNQDHLQPGGRDQFNRWVQQVPWKY